MFLKPLKTSSRPSPKISFNTKPPHEKPIRRALRIPFQRYAPRIIGVASIIFIFIVFLHFFFMVHQVNFSNAYGDPVALKGIEQLKGKNLLLMTESEVISALIKSNPALKTVRLIKLYPQTVKLIVEMHEPVAYYVIADDTYVLLADNAISLAYAYERPKDIGEIAYYQNLTNGEYPLGEQIRLTDIAFATAIAGQIHKNGFVDYAISIEDTELVEVVINKITIKAANKGNKEAQLKSIQQVLRLIKTSGEQIKSVDVRFDKMILEKW